MAVISSLECTCPGTVLYSTTVYSTALLLLASPLAFMIPVALSRSRSCTITLPSNHHHILPFYSARLHRFTCTTFFERFLFRLSSTIFTHLVKLSGPPLDVRKVIHFGRHCSPARHLTIVCQLLSTVLPAHRRQFVRLGRLLPGHIGHFLSIRSSFNITSKPFPVLCRFAQRRCSVSRWSIRLFQPYCHFCFSALPRSSISSPQRMLALF